MKMMRTTDPKQYKVAEKVGIKDLVNNGFSVRGDYYVLKKTLYGNMIFLKLYIDKTDHFLIVKVEDAEGVTYSPFYNPNNRLNNHMYLEVVKNYNNFMDCLVRKKILIHKENSVMAEQTIKIKYFNNNMTKLEYIDGKSDWIDLRAAEDVELKKGEFKLIPLGVAMEIPEGYEAHVVPRSSTFKNYGVLQTNSTGIIDNSYAGPNDQWFMPVVAMRNTKIKFNERICQFRIMKNQPTISFVEDSLENNDNRGGHGSTGKN